MMNPELERVRELAMRRRAELGEPRVDRRPVGDDLGDRRAREQPALRTRMAGADALVVRVEEVVVRVVERGSTKRTEDEALEEPRRMSEVPLHGARVGHRLRDPVLDLERVYESHRRAASGKD